jgi:hypothetical protein
MTPNTELKHEHKHGIQRATDARSLAKLAMLKPPATDHLANAQNARHYAELLVANGLWMAALNYLSHAIPPREGIWWGWYCARKATPPDPPPETLQALKVVETWIAQPTEANRALARDYALRIPSGSPAHCVLEAISFNGELEDPITGAKGPAVPYMSSKFVAAAVIGASYFPDPEHPETTSADYIRQAFDVANRIQLWAQYN